MFPPRIYRIEDNLNKLFCVFDCWFAPRTLEIDDPAEIGAWNHIFEIDAQFDTIRRYKNISVTKQ